MTTESITARIAAMRSAKAERHAAIERAREVVRALDILDFCEALPRLQAAERACPDCTAGREAGYLAGATSAPLREPRTFPCRRHREARKELAR